MAEGRSTSYRVRIAGQELQVADLETLLRLARDGQLGGSAEVRAPGSSSWIPMAQILATHAPRRDPWSVWEAAEQVDPKSIWEEFAPPAAASAPPGRPREPEVEDLPPHALSHVPLAEDEPTDPGHPAPPPARPAAPPRRMIEEVRRPAGKVILFPPRAGPTSRPIVEGPYALDVEEPVPLRPPPPPRAAPILPPDLEPDPSVRWWRLATLLVVGLLVLGLYRWYVRGQAIQVYPATDAGPAPVAALVAAQPRAAPRSAESSPYASVEEQLRSLLPSETKEVRVETALEDALLVELRAMHVEALKVEAPILTWTGRKNDVPQRTEIRVHLRDEEDNLDWDLGAVGLVVGKYIQRYSLDVQRLEVMFEGATETPRRIAITPESARQLYLERKSLLEFLKTH